MAPSPARISSGGVDRQVRLAARSGRACSVETMAHELDTALGFDAPATPYVGYGNKW